MKKISTPIIVMAFCFAAFASCSKDVKKPAGKVVVSNATTKTGSTTTTQTTTIHNQGGGTCGHNTCGGNSCSNNSSGGY